MQSYAFSNGAARSRNEGSCLSLHNNEREKQGCEFRLQTQSRILGQDQGSRTHTESGELSLVLSRQRKLWVPQPDLSGSGMLTFIANLLTYLCWLSCEDLTPRQNAPGLTQKVYNKSQPGAWSDDRPEETPLLMFLDILWNFPAQEMYPEPTVKALFTAVTTFPCPLACPQAPWAGTPDGGQIDYLQEAAST